jgi:hypothetical protein
LFAAAAGCSAETPDPLPVEMTVTFFGQEPQRRLLSCGEQTAVELVTLRGHLTDQRQAKITTRLDPATHICAIEVDPPLNPQTSDIDWFLPSWAVEKPSDFEKQMRFSVTAEKGADSTVHPPRRLVRHRAPTHERVHCDWLHQLRDQDELTPIRSWGGRASRRGRRDHFPSLLAGEGQGGG